MRNSNEGATRRVLSWLRHGLVAAASAYCVLTLSVVRSEPAMAPSSEAAKLATTCGTKFNPEGAILHLEGDGRSKVYPKSQGGGYFECNAVYQEFEPSLTDKTGALFMRTSEPVKSLIVPTSTAKADTGGFDFSRIRLRNDSVEWFVNEIDGVLHLRRKGLGRAAPAKPIARSVPSTNGRDYCSDVRMDAPTAEWARYAPSIRVDLTDLDLARQSVLGPGALGNWVHQAVARADVRIDDTIISKQRHRRLGLADLEGDRIRDLRCFYRALVREEQSRWRDQVGRYIARNTELGDQMQRVGKAFEGVNKALGAVRGRVGRLMEIESDIKHAGDGVALLQRYDTADIRTYESDKEAHSTYGVFAVDFPYDRAGMSKVLARLRLSKVMEYLAIWQLAPTYLQQESLVRQGRLDRVAVTTNQVGIASQAGSDDLVLPYHPADGSRMLGVALMRYVPATGISAHDQAVPDGRVFENLFGGDIRHWHLSAFTGPDDLPGHVQKILGTAGAEANMASLTIIATLVREAVRYNKEATAARRSLLVRVSENRKQRAAQRRELRSFVEARKAILVEELKLLKAYHDALRHAVDKADALIDGEHGLWAKEKATIEVAAKGNRRRSIGIGFFSIPDSSRSLSPTFEALATDMLQTAIQRSAFVLQSVRGSMEGGMLSKLQGYGKNLKVEFVGGDFYADRPYAVHETENLAVVASFDLRIVHAENDWRPEIAKDRCRQLQVFVDKADAGLAGLESMLAARAKTALAKTLANRTLGCTALLRAPTARNDKQTGRKVSGARPRQRQRHNGMLWSFEFIDPEANADLYGALNGLRQSANQTARDHGPGWRLPSIEEIEALWPRLDGDRRQALSFRRIFTNGPGDGSGPECVYVAARTFEFCSVRRQQETALLLVQEP